ncbi:hypothetical protein SNE40_008698 [Patella caerulea]|uniref:Uncharacterized protein n=1 Tax=Patella caerulea TaxID=87958 RepID=A0AAN8JSE8_PATCE
MMMKLLICCICVVVYKQSFVDGLNSNLRIKKRDQIASKLLLLQQLAIHYDDRDGSQNKLSGDQNLMIYDRLASKMNRYDEDEIELKIKNILDIRNALDNRDVDGSKLGGFVQARNRIRRSVDDMIKRWQCPPPKCWKLGRLH